VPGDIVSLGRVLGEFVFQGVGDWSAGQAAPLEFD
jgi:hypothetical protein